MRKEGEVVYLLVRGWKVKAEGDVFWFYEIYEIYPNCGFT